MEAIYLQSMTDFIESKKPIHADLRKESFSAIQTHINETYDVIFKYCAFLKQPLQLGFFVPCDENGNVLKEPYFDGENDHYYSAKKEEFEKAKERVLFKDFSIRTENKKKYVCIEGYEIEVSVLPRLKMTIEDLSNDWNHIELTDSAIKQIGL